MSFTERTDEIEYSTDECIKDRLETIRNQSEEDYKYVIANILTAKAYLKRIGAYKKSNAAEPEPGKPDTRGGFGAVGIENWVLQNGGSFEKAAREFLKTAKECKNLEEFKTKYSIWDFGENHIASEKGFYSHDNFVYNMNENGYQKMREGLSNMIERIDSREKIEKEPKVGIKDLVEQDPTVLLDKDYMDAIATVVEKGNKIEKNEIGE